nr:Transmembrane protein 45B [Hymenolepis microstoma]
MGTFAGHALPGSFFLIFGIWGIFFQLKKYYRRKKYELGFSNRRDPVYKNQMTTPIQCCQVGCCGRKEFPLDSYLKAVFCAIGITGEIYTGFNNGVFKYTGNLQHSTMFAMFMLSGIFEVLNFYQIFRLPNCTNYFLSFLAITAELILFAFHLHGRTPTDIYVHTILIYALIILLAVGLCEATFSHSILAGLVRNLLIIVQGSWFWQVGAILYPPLTALPRFDELAIESIPRVTNIFIWHIIITLSFICFTAVIMGFSLRNPPANVTNNRSDRRRLLAQEDGAESDNSLSENELMEMRQWKTTYLAHPVSAP